MIAPGPDEVPFQLGHGDFPAKQHGHSYTKYFTMGPKAKTKQLDEKGPAPGTYDLPDPWNDQHSRGIGFGIGKQRGEVRARGITASSD